MLFPSVRKKLQNPVSRENSKTLWFHCFLWFLLAGAFLYVFYPVISSLISSWSHSEESSQGFFIAPIALFIVWSKREKLSQLPRHSSWFGFAVVVFSLLLFIVARLAEILTLASFAMIIFLAGTVLFFYGWKIFQELIFPLFLLLLMIPIPSQIYSVATIPLQLFVSKISVALASLVGAPVLREGNVITLPGHSMEVVQACSGLRSLTSLVTLAILLGYFSLRSNLLRGLLVAAAVPVAVLVNIVRVLLMILALYYFNLDLTAESIHTYYGLAIFVLALVMLVLLGRLFSVWDSPQTQD